MHDKIVYIYACKHAIKSSKTIIPPSNKRGIIPTTPIITTKPANIFSTIWPITIFITKRTVKLNDFESNDIISIGTINGANHKGIPLGRKVLK